MKILIPLTAALMLASCTPSDQKKEQSTKEPDTNRQGMDSPITVSDGSPTTYLRHPSFIVKNEQNPDDSNNYEIHAHVNDSGFMAYKITCTSGCTLSNRTTLVAPWKVELWDDVSHSGHKYGIVKSADGIDVKTHFFNNPIQVVPDGTTPGITDVVQNTYAPRSAVLTNSSGPPVYFVCDKADGSSVRCTITIDYCDNPANPGCK